MVSGHPLTLRDYYIDTPKTEGPDIWLPNLVHPSGFRSVLGLQSLLAGFHERSPVDGGFSESGLRHCGLGGHHFSGLCGSTPPGLSRCAGFRVGKRVIHGSWE